MFECQVRYQDKWWHLAHRKEEGQAKRRCTEHFKLHGQVQEYRILNNGDPWLTGKTISPRAADPRVEWREDFK